MGRSRKKAHIVGPVVLILVGVVLLLNSLGWTAISVWDLLRLWPVLLVAAGLELLVGRRGPLASAVVFALVLAMLGGGLFILTVTGSTDTAGERITVPLADATRADVDIGFGVGNLAIAALADSNRLIQGTIELPRGERLEHTLELVGGTAYARLHSGVDWPVSLFGWDGDKTWDLELNRQVPLELKVGVGVGDASLDLRRLNLTGLHLDTGVSRATVVLPQRGDLAVQIDGGIGDLVIEVPEGTEVRVNMSTGLGHASAPTHYGRKGESYVSPGYDAAGNRVDVNAEIGIGRILVREHR